jgi:hypothetical protein
MQEQDIDYTVGLSPAIRQNVRPDRVCDLIKRAIDGDPGDANEPECLMETISNHMNGRNSCHFFSPEGCYDDPVFLLLKPKDRKVLVLSGLEMGREDMQQAVEAFGFDGVSLRPLYDDEDPS